MKTIAITLATLALVSTAAAAAPAKHGYQHGYGKGHGYTHGARITPRERAAINHSAARLAFLKRRVWADGRINFIERARINMAQRRHNALVAQARRW